MSLRLHYSCVTMVSVDVTLPFQRVSKNGMMDENSNLACGCNCFQDVPHFKVTLNSHMLKNYLEFT